MSIVLVAVCLLGAEEPKAWIEVGGKVPGTIHWEGLAAQDWRVFVRWQKDPDVVGRKREITRSVCVGRLVKYSDGICTFQFWTKGQGKQFKEVPFAQLSRECKGVVETQLKWARKNAEKRKVGGESAPAKEEEKSKSEEKPKSALE